MSTQSSSIGRRDFLCLVTASALSAAIPSSLMGASQGKRPNILIILADDMGFSYPSGRLHPCGDRASGRPVHDRFH